MRLTNWFSTTSDHDKKKGVTFPAMGLGKADVLQVNESSHRVDENGNVELNFDDSQVQRVLRKRLDNLRDYDLTDDLTNA